MLREEEYHKLISWAPIVFVDVIISNQRGELLLGKRRNIPYRGEWFFIGGRVWKGEDPKEAAVRQVLEETGIALNTNEFRFITVRSRSYKDIDRHDIVLIYAALVPDNIALQANEEHSEIRFFKELPELNQEAREVIRSYKRKLKRKRL